MAQYGRTTVGAEWFGCEARYVCRKITLASTETALKISAYLRSQGSATNGLKAFLYNFADNSFAYQSSELSGFTDTTGAWRDFTFTSSVTAGDYWLGVIGDGIPGGANTVEIAMDTVAADTANYQWYSFSGTWPTLSADLDGESAGGFQFATNNTSIYLETSSGGGSTINAATIIPQLNRRKTGRFF